MKITRRAFFLHPTRAVGEDLENAGEWLRRHSRKNDAVRTGGGSASAETEQGASARGIGLRKARENMRRNIDE